jgi:hypothetical protein
MKILAPYVNSVDAADIAAYIANPAAANGTPAISLSASSVTFAAQTLVTTSPAQTVTVSNTGTAALNLSAITLTGAASADFTRSGTCVNGTSVAAGGNCSIQLTFRPTATGTRNATVTITHNASGGTSTIAIVGTGAPGPAVASVTPAMLSYTQTISTVSAAQAITVRNSGGQPLTLGAISITGANAAEFSIGTGATCAASTVVNPSATCTLPITFRPTAAGARSASVAIAHNAAGSPATVALNGTATVTAQPAISLSAASLTFGEVAVGSNSAAQTVTLTNSGQAVLTLGTLTIGGLASGDFSRGGTCTNGATIAAAGTCTMQLTFAPTAVGDRTGTLTVTSNALNGAQSVSLSGSAVHYAISVNPTAATLKPTVLGAMSEAVQAVVANSGGSPLMLMSIAVTGPFALTQGANACGDEPIMLSPGQSCNVYVAFQPAAAGMASGEVMITSAASAEPTRIALTAEAVAEPAAAVVSSSALSPSNSGAGGCSVGAPGQLVDPLLAVMLAVALFVVLVRRNKPATR